MVTSDSNHELEVYLNLASRMKLTGVNQLWVADIPYIRLHREFVFLAVILDAFARKVVGGELDRTLAARLPIAALEEGNRGTKAAAGRGASFRSRRSVCIGRLRRGATQTRHDPKHEPACESLRQRQCESFMKTLKREEIYANEYRDMDHLRENIAAFIDSYYNRVWLHSALGYKPPEEFEARRQPRDDIAGDFGILNWPSSAV